MDNIVNHRTWTWKNNILGGLKGAILLLFYFLVLVYIDIYKFLSTQIYIMGTKSGTLNPLKIPSINTIKGNTSIHDASIQKNLII